MKSVSELQPRLQPQTQVSLTQQLKESQPPQQSQSASQASGGDSDQRIARLIGLDEMPGNKRADSHDAPVIASLNPLHGIKATLEVCVGRTEVSVGSLIGAKVNDVLVVNRKIDEPVDLMLNGSVVARGVLVASDGHFAIRITELPLPLKP